MTGLAVAIRSASSIIIEKGPEGPRSSECFAQTATAVLRKETMLFAFKQLSASTVTTITPSRNHGAPMNGGEGNRTPERGIKSPAPYQTAPPVKAPLEALKADVE